MTVNPDSPNSASAGKPPAKTKPLSTVTTSDQTVITDEDAPKATPVVVVEGSQLGKYQVRSLLGSGSMGAVFLAFDPMIEREVAIKVLPVEIAARPMALDRFLTEARSTGRLSHPNVVSIYDIAEQNGQYYIVMEVLGGDSLAELTEDGACVPWKDACRMVADAADGLAAAHAAGLIHRDIKPGNLMSTRDGVVKVVDFGLSKLTDAENDTRDATTKHGTILGTPQYMSPEQCETASVDSRSDIYSLGGTLFRLLTGRHPYEEIPALLQVMMAHARSPIPDPLKHKSELPAACRDIVAKAMAKKTQDRYQDASEMSADLRTLIHADAAISSISATAPGPLKYRPLTSVVIVEPSKMQALMLSRELTQSRVDQVTVCGSQAEAQKLLNSATPDVLITSMQLPDGKGTDLLATQRANDGEFPTMLVLNSSDSSLDNLIRTGESGPLALVSKKARPREIVRAIYSCAFLDCSDAELVKKIDPMASRFLIVGDSPQIPDVIASQIRRLGLLDLQITTFDDLSAGHVSAAKADLVLAIRTAGDALNDTQAYVALLDRFETMSSAVAVAQIDGDRSVLRAFRCDGFDAVTRCLLDDTRLSRLIQVVQGQQG